jgi:beta-lactamase class D
MGTFRFAIAITVIGLLPGHVRADTLSWLNPPSEFTEEESVCLALHSARSDTWLVNNLEQCEMMLSPCSTFKIPNTLIAMETGVLSGPTHSLQWDGTVHGRKSLNQDHDLSSAIRYSVVWYFQQVAKNIGAPVMQQKLDLFDYGNRDISGGLDKFWLSSSLLINALEQVKFLQQLSSQSLPAKPEHQETLNSLLRQDYDLPEGFRGTLYGKTGSCVMPEQDHGWFVGWLERDNDQVVFAVNIIGKNKWSTDARRIALKMLQNLD